MLPAHEALEPVLHALRGIVDLALDLLLDALLQAVELTAEGEGPEQRHVTGTLTYFYCVKESGFCAPAKKQIELPLIVVDG